jgi:hypothetical protein
MNFRKLIGLLVLTALLGGSAFAASGCFEETYGPAPYAYGGPAYYPYGPGPAYRPPVVYGDWDEHHAWHDRDWWMANRRPWVESHHHEWLEHHGHESRERLAHELHEHHEWH